MATKSDDDFVGTWSDRLVLDFRNARVLVADDYASAIIAASLISGNTAGSGAERAPRVLSLHKAHQGVQRRIVILQKPFA